MTKMKYFIWILSASMSLAADIVLWDGSNIQTRTTNALGIITNIIAQPYPTAFGCLRNSSNPFRVATNVFVTDGTITNGTVTNTWLIDGSYLVVNESGQFKIDYRFTNGTERPFKVHHIGRYEGNPAHNVKIYAFNFSTNAFTSLTGDANDFPNSTTDESKYFNIPSPQTSYIDQVTGVSTIRIEHLSVAVSANNFYTDYISLLYAGLVLTNVNAKYKVTGLTLAASNNITIAPLVGEIVTITSGWYRVGIAGSGTGASNTTYQLMVRTNGIDSTVYFYRRIGSAGDIGNAGDFGYFYLPGGCTNSLWLGADTSNAWASFVNSHFSLERVGQ